MNPALSIDMIFSMVWPVAVVAIEGEWCHGITTRDVSRRADSESATNVPSGTAELVGSN